MLSSILMVMSRSGPFDEDVVSTAGSLGAGFLVAGL